MGEAIIRYVQLNLRSIPEQKRLDSFINHKHMLICLFIVFHNHFILLKNRFERKQIGRYPLIIIDQPNSDAAIVALGGILHFFGYIGYTGDMNNDY